MEIYYVINFFSYFLMLAVNFVEVHGYRYMKKIGIAYYLFTIFIGICIVKKIEEICTNR